MTALQLQIFKCFQRHFYGDFTDVHEIKGIIKSLQRQKLFPSNKDLKNYQWKEYKNKINI